MDRNPNNSARSNNGGVASCSKKTMDVTILYVVGCENFVTMSLWSKALKLYLVVVNYPPDATNGILLLSHLSNSIGKLAVENPGYNSVIGGDFNHFEISQVTKNTHCTWIKTSDTRSKSCSDKTFVSKTGLFDQVETIKTSFITDHLAVVLQPKKPLKAERRKVKSETIAFRIDRGWTWH